MKKIYFLIVFIAASAAAGSVRADATTTAIHLDIESATSTVWSGDIAVEPCSPSGAASTTNAYCALEQSGIPQSWSSYGSDVFLDSLGGFANDFGANLSWLWFADDAYGDTSLNNHLLSEGENLLLAYGRMPLKTTLSTSTPAVRATTTISVAAFSFDSSWNPVWAPIGSSTLYIDGAAFSTSASGTYDFIPASAATTTVQAKLAGYVDSMAAYIYPVAAATSSASTSTTASESASSGQRSHGGSGGSAPASAPDLSKAVSFLEGMQLGDGSYSSDINTDWAAIALARFGGSSKAKIAAYERSSSPSMSRATDYERHAMALMALGISPYDGTSVDYIAKIVSTFDGSQIGDSGLANDDIFSLFPLIAAGYPASDPMIGKIASFIVSRQAADGSWNGSIDVTASAIQALSLVRGAAGATDAIAKASQYLKAMQQSDGGFGSSFSTSWAVQAIVALGESPSSWQRNGKSPLDSLAAAQQADGGFETAATNSSARVWATAYAIPAIGSRTWMSMLDTFSRPTPSTETTASAPEATVASASSTAPAIPAAQATSSAATTSAPAIEPKPVAPLAVVKAPAPKAAVEKSEASEPRVDQSQGEDSRAGARDSAATAEAGKGSDAALVWIGSGVALLGLGFVAIKKII